MAPADYPIFWCNDFLQDKIDGFTNQDVAKIDDNLKNEDEAKTDDYLKNEYDLKNGTP